MRRIFPVKCGAPIDDVCFVAIIHQEMESLQLKRVSERYFVPARLCV